MDERQSRRRRRRQIDNRARFALVLLCDAEDVLAEAHEVKSWAVPLLLALKVGPMRPIDLARAVNRPRSRVADQLSRFLASYGGTTYLAYDDGLYSLTKRGHDLVNRVSAAANGTQVAKTIVQLQRTARQER